jgi:hypothetical protein
MKTIYDEINSAVLRKLYCHFFDTIPAESLNIYFILTPIFLFQMPSSFDKGRF